MVRNENVFLIHTENIPELKRENSKLKMELLELLKREKEQSATHLLQENIRLREVLEKEKEIKNYYLEEYER